MAISQLSLNKILTTVVLGVIITLLLLILLDEFGPYASVDESFFEVPTRTIEANPPEG